MLLKDFIMFDKLKEIEEEYKILQKQISEPSIINNHQKLKEVSIRLNEISDIVKCYQEYKKISDTIEVNKEFIKEEDDKEIIELAEEENKQLQEQKVQLENKLKKLLIPKDPNDEKNAIIEIRAGTGGKEAALFAADLYRMYSRFFERKGWKKDVINSNSTGIGGFKEIVMAITGKNVYGTLKYESGVHRVQRVPETESSGRVHTSAASVAVLPEAEEVEIEIDKNDLKIEVFRSTGPGGQSVNTTDSAVRIVHIPTGLIVTCQDEKSQMKNKNRAMQVLRARLLDMKISEQQKERARNRKLQVGSGDRSAKIRTYNFPQSRVTDHRINYTSYNLESIMNGELDEFLKRLKSAGEQELINQTSKE